MHILKSKTNTRRRRDSAEHKKNKYFNIYISDTSSSNSDPSLVSGAMIIALLVWIAVVTIILFVDIILMIRYLSLKDHLNQNYSEQKAPAQPYYPKFFPRVAMEDTERKAIAVSDGDKIESRAQSFSMIPVSKMSKWRNSGGFYFYGYSEKQWIQIELLNSRFEYWNKTDRQHNGLLSFLYKTTYSQRYQCTII